MPSYQLLTCPFCGAVPDISHFSINKGPVEYVIECNGEHCEAVPDIIDPVLTKAISAWNTRVEHKMVSVEFPDTPSEPPKMAV